MAAPRENARKASSRKPFHEDGGVGRGGGGEADAWTIAGKIKGQGKPDLELLGQAPSNPGPDLRRNRATTGHTGTIFSLNVIMRSSYGNKPLCTVRLSGALKKMASQEMLSHYQIKVILMSASPTVYCLLMSGCRWDQTGPARVNFCQVILYKYPVVGLVVPRPCHRGPGLTGGAPSQPSVKRCRWAVNVSGRRAAASR